jgi:carbamoyl-phosphate synthase large subunit
MRSTGEVMGIADDFPTAFGKSQLASFNPLPQSGLIFISVADRDKPEIIPVARELADLGFRLVASAGTARALRSAGLEVLEICKIQEGRPNLLDLLKNEKVGMVINTPSGLSADEAKVRAAANAHNVSSVTTVAAAQAAVQACRAMRNQQIRVTPLQDLLRDYAPPGL